MDFRELKYIVTTAECQSFTAAAKKLYISQPSLSYVISKVEEETGVLLFDRKTTPITLTYAGKRYVETAREILALHDSLQKELHDIENEESGEINLGIPTERAGYMLPRVLKRFRSSFPKVSLRLKEARSSQIVHDLESGTVDLAILPGRTDDLPPGLQTELIYREKLYLVADKSMITKEMILEKESDDRPALLDLSKMKNIPFILMGEGQYIRKYAERILHEAGLNPEEMVVVTSGITAVQLAKAGLGATIISERAIIPQGGIHEVPCFRYVGSDAQWDVNVVYRQGMYLSRSTRYFIDLLKEEFGK